MAAFEVVGEMMYDGETDAFVVEVNPLRLAAHVIFANTAAECGVEYAQMITMTGRGKSPRLRDVAAEYALSVRTWAELAPLLRGIQRTIDAELGLPARPPFVPGLLAQRAARSLGR